MSKPFILERVRFPYTIRDPETKKPIVNIFDLSWLPAILELPKILEELNSLREKAGLPTISYRDLKVSTPRTTQGVAINIPVSEGDIFLSKKGDRYKVVSIGGLITLDWVDGKYRRDVTRETLSKHYTREKKLDDKPVEIVPEGREGEIEDTTPVDEENFDGIPKDL